MVAKVFKNTEIGLIPEDWEVKIMSDICWVNQGLQIEILKRKAFPSFNSKKYITIQFLNDGKEVEYVDDYSLNVVVYPDDILMTRTGNTGIVVTNVEGVFHNNFFKINYDCNKVNRLYLLYFLRFPNTQKVILKKAGTSTIPDLNHNDFYTITIPLPQLTEQKAIAEALSDADAWTANLEQLIAKKRLIKQGAMQQLLSPKEDWEVKKLREMVIIAKSGGTPLSSNKNFYNGGIPFLSISDMTKQGKYIRFTTNSISQEGIDNSASWLVPINTIIYSMYASVGFVSINKIELATSQAVINLRLKGDYALDFIYYTLLSMQKSVLKYVGEGTQKNLNAQTVKDFEIYFPKSLTEQTRIAKILSDMDTEIEGLENQLAKALQIKQGMMQELLMGRVRLV